MEKFKKILLVILFIAVAGGVGFMLYRFFFAVPGEKAPPTTGVETTVPGGGLPTAGELIPPKSGAGAGGEPSAEKPVLPSASLVASGGRTLTRQVAPDPILEPTMSPSGNLTYYNENDGRFYAVDSNGNNVRLSNKRFPSAKKITWSPNTDKAVIEFPDDVKIIYDFESEQQVTLPKHWSDFDFSSDGEMIVAKSLGLDPENQWLITADTKGSNARLVEHLGNNADKVTVNVSPDSSVLAFSRTGDPVGFDTREILLIGQNNENYKALRVEGFNFKPVWSPNGGNIIYSASSRIGDYRPTLWFVNATGDTVGQRRVNLGVNTWAEKCTFTNDTTVYCAVPDSLPVGVGLQPDLPPISGDSIFRIDLAKGTKELIGKPEEDTTISTIVVSDDESVMYLQNAETGTVSEMRLK